jgi:hypothetical protein
LLSSRWWTCSRTQVSLQACKNACFNTIDGLGVCHAGQTSSAQLAAAVQVLGTSEPPPTHFRTNKFTACFQTIVDAYGVARYREVGCAYLTPFAWAHAGLLAAAAEGKGRETEMCEPCRVLASPLALAVVLRPSPINTGDTGQWGRRHGLLLVPAGSSASMGDVPCPAMVSGPPSSPTRGMLIWAPSSGQR